MAYAHGTATSNIDLWNKFVTFITTNAALVAANEQWSIVWTAPSGAKDGIVIKGPGASGNDSILVGLNRVDSPAEDENAIWVRGMTGFLSGALNIDGHVNPSFKVGAYFDANPMEYWFVASGRRFVIVAKMSTVYSAIYGGFFLPYANPIAYPYPLMVGASCPDWTGNVNTNAVNRWRSQSPLHHHFPFSEYNTPAGAQAARSSMYMLDPSGTWLNAGNNTDANLNIAPFYYTVADPAGDTAWALAATTSNSVDTFGYSDLRSRIEENIGGGYSLSPFSMIQTTPTVQTYGVMDGVYSAPGQGNAVENIIVLNGVNHLVVQDVFRTDVRNYWALKLE